MHGRNIILLGEQCSNPYDSWFSVGLGKSSLPCVYSSPPKVEVWDYGRRHMYIYHDTHLRSSELWSSFMNVLHSVTLCNPITPDSSVYILGRFYRTPHLGMPLGGWSREQYVNVSCQPDVDRGCLEDDEYVFLFLMYVYLLIVQYRVIYIKSS
jgi:hypothetical protein